MKGEDEIKDLILERYRILVRKAYKVCERIKIFITSE